MKMIHQLFVLGLRVGEGGLINQGDKCFHGDVSILGNLGGHRSRWHPTIHWFAFWRLQSLRGGCCCYRSGFVFGAFDELRLNAHFHHEFMKVDALRVQSNEFHRSCRVGDEFTGCTGDVIFPVSNRAVCIDDHFLASFSTFEQDTANFFDLRRGEVQVARFAKNPLDTGISKRTEVFVNERYVSSLA